jgi:hypothetical protein
MATDLNIEALDEFNDMVDQITEDIEAGRVKANPLKPVAKTAAEIDAEDLAVTETATETGEEVFVAESEAVTESEVEDNYAEGDIIINGKGFLFCTDFDDIIGKPGTRMIVVSNDSGEVIFGSAAIAARETGYNPTTMRSWASQERVDDSGTWMYRDKPENV